MAEAMKVEIISKETIKPSSPTPPNLKKYNMSIFDQIAPNYYGSILYFYSKVYEKDDDRSLNEKIDSVSKSLKSSLSKTLTRFYPFAGRLGENGTSIECTDEGAIFIEARVNRDMALVIDEYSGYSTGENFLLGGIEPKDGEMLIIQANFFKCGGLAIGLSMSHKLTDGSTMSVFVKAWSNPDDNTPIDFSLPATIPRPVDPSSLPRIDRYPVDYNFVEKRYVLDNSKISLLKEKAISEGVKGPTRVECVTCLFWKCVIRAASKSRNEVESRPSMFMQAVNLRTRIIPPLPLNTIGNMLGSLISTCEDLTKTNLSDLIANMRKGVDAVCKRAKDGFKTEEILERIKEEAQLFIKYDTYRGTSWCRFPVYEIDLGFGKPTWVCPGFKPHKNVFLLLDTKDGSGIELWCALSEEFITFLEQDEEFLTYAALI
ncbi:hypothetical protein ACFE04_031359 [Oxalis oulophora]